MFAVPMVSHPDSQASLERFYTVTSGGGSGAGGGGESGGQAFLRHPLNAARVQLALQRLRQGGSGTVKAADRASLAQAAAECTALALSSGMVAWLQGEGGLTAHASLCAKISNAYGTASGGVAWEASISPTAFVHWSKQGDNVAVTTPKPKPTARPPAPPAAKTLLAICAAGVADKTITVLLGLEGNRYSEAFDLIVGVSPYPGDSTADFIEAAGIMVLRQPKAIGLSDLWNRLFRYAFFDQAHVYDNLIFSNNDVLVPPGVVTDMTAVLEQTRTSHTPRVVTVLSQTGGNNNPIDKVGG